MKLLFAIALALAVFSVNAQTKLRYAHVGVANAPQTLYADEVAKLVKERTNGRVEIQVFANSQLGGVNEMVHGVRSGAIQIAHHDFGSLGRIVSNTAVFNTPFMYRDPEHAMRATDPALSPALREINQELVQKGNMRIVAALFQGPRHLTCEDRVVSSKDMQGKKYRGVPIKLWSSMLTGMGAVATPVEVSELATALATGLVVGQENPLPNIYNLKLYEVQKFVMLTGHMQSILSVFVNERAWQQIPAADRKILDTPGHADFGGEVERVLSMVDGVLLLVDAVEGPMPQTRFVTRKALALGLKPIVVVNKVDRPGARPEWVVNQTFDLFDKLGANEDQLDFPVIYASALLGYAKKELDHESTDMAPLFEAILKYVPVRDEDPDAPLQLQICSLDYSSYVGKIGIGRIRRGRLRAAQEVLLLPDNIKAKVNQVLMFEGLERMPVDEAEAGDIVLINGKIGRAHV